MAIGGMGQALTEKPRTRRGFLNVDRTTDQEEGTAHRRVNSQDDRSILADGNYVLSPDTNLWKRLSFPSLVLS